MIIYKRNYESKKYIHNYVYKIDTYKKKSGFTLIELIAVIAIIGILASILLPKLNNYINEAKKLKVVDQSRKVVMAVESYNLKYDTPISKDTKVNTIQSKSGVKKYLEEVELKNLNPSSASLQNCYDIVNGAEFDFEEGTEILNPSTIVVINSTTDNKSEIKP